MNQSYKPGIIGRDSDYRLYSDIKCLKGIVREVKDGSITERLVFEKGDIVIIAGTNRLDAYSVSHRQDNNDLITYRCSQDIRRGISPEKALSNAKSGIISRIRYFEKIREMKEFQKVVAPKQFNPRGLEETITIDNPEELEKIDGISPIGIAS